MLLLAALTFTAVFALAAVVLLETLGANRRKIAAALQGRSLLAQPMIETRPVQVRITSRRVSRPVSARPRQRVAA
jgi:hypothetical protein